MKSTTALILSTAIGSTTGFAPVQTTPRTPTSLAFFGTAKKSAPKSSPLADEAVELYTAKYSGGARQKLFFESWGMPESYQAPEDTSASIFDRKNAELTSTFNTIASLYGEDEALKMVKIQPGILAFNEDNFKPSLEAFGENFGYEESKEMIIRNPGLLSVKPANAAVADDLTMQLSYVVDFTRPIGAAGPIFVVFLLTIPAIESATGVSRGDWLSSLF